MKVFFDTEFTGLHQNTTLISIGLIAENGREFYAEFCDYDDSLVDSWIEQNVIANLIYLRSEDPTNYADGVHMGRSGASDYIADELKKWFTELMELSDDDKIELWSDCLAYDWVLFCQLFGGAMLLPGYIYYIPFDISTLFKLKGIDPDTNREEFSGMIDNQQKHNALWDAKVIRACFEKLSTQATYALSKHT